jgi:hypothetical protein
MAKLKCKSCNGFFELNGSEDINCPLCGVKLTNSFTEWKKREGNEHKSFENYKHKKCYPSSNSRQSSVQEISNVHQSPIIKNSRRSSSSSSSSRKTFSKQTILYISIVFAIILVIITNPDIADHKKAFHDVVWGDRYADQYKVVRHIVNHVLVKTEMVLNQNDALKNELKRCNDLELKITISDYLFFSRTNITLNGSTYLIGTGFCGHVFLSDKINYFRKP